MMEYYRQWSREFARPEHNPAQHLDSRVFVEEILLPCLAANKAIPGDVLFLYQEVHGKTNEPDQTWLQGLRAFVDDVELKTGYGHYQNLAHIGEKVINIYDPNGVGTFFVRKREIGPTSSGDIWPRGLWAVGAEHGFTGNFPLHYVFFEDSERVSVATCLHWNGSEFSVKGYSVTYGLRDGHNYPYTGGFPNKSTLIEVRGTRDKESSLETDAPTIFAIREALEKRLSLPAGQGVKGEKR